MKRKLLLLLAIPLIAAGCGRSRSAQAQTAPATADLRTIDAIDPAPVVLDPPPVLTDEAPPPKPKAMPWETPEPIIFTPEDEKVRAALPFSPAIAMDPVDGSKISIRASTPMHEYKGKIYYFSSAAHKQQFVANPEDFLKGGFSRL